MVTTNNSFELADTRFFISYKRNVQPDERIANEIYAQLTQAFGTSIFLDRGSLLLSDDWKINVGSHIRNADYFVLLLSNAVFKSPDNIRDELEIALEEFANTGKRPRIVPVLVDSKMAVPDTFIRVKRYHCFEWFSTKDTKLLIDKLIELGRFNERERGKARRNNSQRQGTSTEDFYVVRQADDQIIRAISRKGVTISLIGSMQTGKTLLLERAMQKASEGGKIVAYLNMASMSAEASEGADRFTRAFLLNLRDRLNSITNLGFVVPVPKYSLDELTPTGACTHFLQHNLLPELKKRDAHLVLVLDDLDAVLTTPSASVFIPMLRSWHALRSYPGSEWKRLDLILVAYSHLFSYARINPPFNVGEDILLEDFGRNQVSELNLAYALPVDVSDVDRLHSLVGGHPYLTQLALKYLCQKSDCLTPSEVLTVAGADRGPFAEHLAILRAKLHDAGLEPHLLHVLQTNKCPDENVFQRLLREGLITRERPTVRLRCELYGEYFRTLLGEQT